MAKIIIRKRIIMHNIDIISAKNCLFQVARNNFNETQLAELLSNTQSSNAFTRWLKATFWPDPLEIGALTLDGDSKSCELHRKFKEYLHGLLRTELDIPEDALGNEEIDEFRVFVVELLLRMTAVALVLAKTQGDKAKLIVKITVDLIGNLSATFPLAPYKSFLDKLRSDEHINFLNLFDVLSDEITLLNKHNAIITESLEALENLKYLTICRIIVEHAPNKTVSFLELDTAEETLNRCQTELMASVAPTENSSALLPTQRLPLVIDTTMLTLPKYISNRARIIALTNSDNLYDLYELLYKLELAIRFVQKVEDMTTTCGWVPIVLKMFNFEELAVCLNKLRENAFTFFDRNRQVYLQCNAGTVFDRKLYVFKNQNREFTFQRLCYLQCPTLLKRIAQDIGNNLLALFSIQNTLQWELMPRQLISASSPMLRLLSPHQMPGGQPSAPPAAVAPPAPPAAVASSLQPNTPMLPLPPMPIGSHIMYSYNEIINLIELNIISLALAEAFQHLNNPNLIETYARLKREAEAIKFSLGRLNAGARRAQNASGSINGEQQGAHIEQNKTRFCKEFNDFLHESEVQFALRHWQRQANRFQPLRSRSDNRLSVQVIEQSRTLTESNSSLSHVSESSPFSAPALPAAAAQQPVPQPTEPSIKAEPNLPLADPPSFLRQHRGKIILSVGALTAGSIFWLSRKPSTDPDEFGAVAVDLVRESAPRAGNYIAKAVGTGLLLLGGKKLVEQGKLNAETRSPVTTSSSSAKEEVKNQATSSSVVAPTNTPSLQPVLTRAMSQPYIDHSTLTEELLESHIQFRPRALSL